MIAIPLAFSSSLLVAAAAPGAPTHTAKVVIIGLDGVSLNLLEPYIEAGVTPNLGKVARDGARGDLGSLWPLRTPQVWTSAVTGKLPGQHGIWDHLSSTYFNPPEVRTEAKLRVTSRERKSKALWGLLGEAGLRTLTVGWMASWPAEEVPGGVMVAPVELVGDPRQTTIKGSFYSDADAMVTPARLEKKVRAAIVDPDDVTSEEIAAYADLPPPNDPFYDGLKYLERYVYGLPWSIARARSVEALTLGLLDDAKPDVVLSYFDCTDSLLHRFWIFKESPDKIRERLAGHGLPTDRAEELHRRFGNVVDACYRDIDARVGRILEATRGPDTLVLIISDHGFGSAKVPHDMPDEPYSGDHLDDGVILAAGPGIAAGSRIEGAGILDVTPTVLHWLGRPVADDMRGHVITGLAANLVGDRRPIQRLATYEAKPQTEVLRPEGWPVRTKPPRTASK